ncbi:hypothetical protein EBR21_00375 [bacterium]|nr:hypothetical protein [bacterium]
MRSFSKKSGCLLAVSLLAILGCQPRRFNESTAQAVGSGGNSFVEELLVFHRNSMAPDLISKLTDTSFYVFNRGCAVGMSPDEVARRPLDGSRDPSYASDPNPFPHPDTCQNSYIDPAYYEMRGVVRRKFDSTPGSNSPGTPRAEGQSSVLDVFQIPPNSPRYRKRCYNSLPNGRAIYRVYSRPGSAFDNTPYYEVRSHDVTVGVIVDIQRIVNEGLDKSPSDQVDLESGFYPRVYLMPGLCGVNAPAGTTKGSGVPGGLPGSLPNPTTQNPASQNPTPQNPTSQNPNGGGVLQPPVRTNPSGQQPGSTLPAPVPANPTQQQVPAQQPSLVPKPSNGTSQQ